MRLRFFFLVFCGWALAVGCQPDEFPESASNDSSSSCGYFEGEVVASWDNDGRKMTLREDFSYVDPHNRRWMAPAGSVVDGASIPAAFWTIIGGPFEGRYRKASVVHDVGCHEMTSSWEDVHRMFYDACVCGGVDQETAKILYYAVYHFGPRWEPVVERVVETHQNDQGQMVQEPVQRRGMRRTKPAAPTTEEVLQVVEMIEDENPSPSMLENTTREVLHRRPRRNRNYNRGNQMEERANPATQFSASGPPTGLEDPSQEANAFNQQFQPSQQDEQQIQNARQTGQQAVQQHNGRGSRTRDQSSMPAITEQEREWVSNQVNDYLVNRLGQKVPDEYGIERTREGYRVALRYYERNQQNEPIGYSSNPPMARVSSNGQVLEIR